jgi:hypothetical protein
LPSFSQRRPDSFDHYDPASVFDSIFVVNLKRQPEKYQRVSEMLTSLGYVERGEGGLLRVLSRIYGIIL